MKIILDNYGVELNFDNNNAIRVEKSIFIMRNTHDSFYCRHIFKFIKIICIHTVQNTQKYV